jgi:hypothetical protein
MRRLMAVTAFAVFLAVPLWAQRGGGGHGGGFGGGHAAGFGGGRFGGRSFSGSHFAGGGMRSGAPLSRGFAGRSYTRDFSRGLYLHDGFHNNGFNQRYNSRFSTFNNGLRFNRHGRFGNCWGRGCNWNNWGWGGWGWGAWGWGWPWWGSWDNDDYNYDQDYYNNLAAAQQMNEENLEEQQMLQQEQAQDYYPQPPRAPRQQAQPPAQQQSEKEAEPVMRPTVLVFRDQHKQEVENYAIVGQMLWAFSPQHQRIPLSELDLPATQRANEERGVDFNVPGSNPGQ